MATLIPDGTEVATWLTFAIDRRPDDDPETEQARRLAATLIVAAMEEVGADPQAIASIRDKLEAVHPDLFPSLH